MTKTKKILIGLLPALAVAGMVYAAPYSLQDLFKKLGLIQKQVEILQEQANGEIKLKGGGQDLSYCYPNVGGSNSGIATTTLFYLAPSVGTTTYIGVGATTTPGIRTGLCDIRRAGLLDVNIIYSATTTTSVLTFEFQFSHDGETWFNETLSTASANNTTMTHGATSTHEIVVGTTGPIYQNITVTPLAAKYFRINVASTRSSGGNLWMNVSKSELNN